MSPIVFSLSTYQHLQRFVNSAKIYWLYLTIEVNTAYQCTKLKFFLLQMIFYFMRLLILMLSYEGGWNVSHTLSLLIWFRMELDSYSKLRTATKQNDWVVVIYYFNHTSLSAGCRYTYIYHLSRNKSYNAIIFQNRERVWNYIGRLEIV